MNVVEREGLVDKDVDVSILSKKSWDSDWPLQKVHTQFIRISKLSVIRQIVWCINCVEPEGQTGKQKLYVPDTPINMWGRDLLQLCSTEINISTIPGTANEEVKCNVIDDRCPKK